MPKKTMKDVEDIEDIEYTPGDVDFEALMEHIEDNLPATIGMFVNGLYNKEAAKKHGDAIGVFYKKLTKSGVMPEHATELTKEYIAAVASFMRLMGPYEE